MTTISNERALRQLMTGAIYTSSGFGGANHYTPKVAISELILYKDNNLKLDDKVQVMLEKLLTAVHVPLETVDIVNLNGLKLPTFGKLKNVNKILTFGLHPKDIGLHVRASYNQALHFETLSVLFCEDLNELATDTAKKKALWKALQEFYQIK